MFLVLLLRNGQLFYIRVVRQVGRAGPRARDRIGRPRDAHHAVVGHALHDLFLEALDEAVKQRVAAHDDHVGEQARPQSDWQILQRLVDELSDAGLAHADVGGVEEDLGYDKSFVAECEDVLVGLRRGKLLCFRMVGRVVRADGARQLLVEVGQDVVFGDAATGQVVGPLLAAGSLPGLFQVALEVQGDEAHQLLHLVDNVGIVSDVKVPQGDLSRHVVCEKFASHVQSTDGRLQRPALEDGRHGGVRVAGIDDEENFGRYVSGCSGIYRCSQQ